MNKGVVKTILKLEIKDMFKMREAVKANMVLICIYLCVAEVASKNSLISNNFEGFYKANLFISSLSSLWTILFGTALMRINSKKNKDINIDTILKFSNYIKWGVFSAIIYQVIFISIRLSNIQDNFIKVFGTLMFMNLYINIIIGIKYISANSLFKS